MLPADNCGSLISIHAPRVGSDDSARRMLEIRQISIHAPRVGSDRLSLHKPPFYWLFQSTLPVWGATPVIYVSLAV